MADYWQTMILPMLEGAKMTVLLFFYRHSGIDSIRLFTNTRRKKSDKTTRLACTYVYLYHAWYTTITTIIINLLWFTYAASNR